MGCNCRKRKSAKYTLILPNGSRETYDSRVKARAAQIAKGGTISRG